MNMGGQIGGALTATLTPAIAAASLDNFVLGCGEFLPYGRYRLGGG
jgi:hypothetical protein